MADNLFDDFNLDMYRGDTRNIRLDLTIPSDPGGVLTAWEFWFTGKLNITDTDVNAKFKRTKANGGVIIVDDALRRLRAIIRPEDTAALAAQTVLFCEAQAKDASGNVQTLAQGKLTVYLDLTQETTPT